MTTNTATSMPILFDNGTQQFAIDRERYERELAQRQQEHLRQIHGREAARWQPCMHDQCTDCHGTGVKQNGSSCVHAISCPCSKCSPTC